MGPILSGAPARGPARRRRDPLARERERPVDRLRGEVDVAQEVLDAQAARATTELSARSTPDQSWRPEAIARRRACRLTGTGVSH